MATKYLTYDEFEKKHLGKAVDYDGVAGVQCVDLVDQYLKDVFGITGVWVSGAREFYTNFDKYPSLVRNFDKIKNTRELVCKKGDIVVWGNGSWGHVAIATGDGNIDWFKSLEENTKGRHEPTQLVTHRFADGGVLGVLRPKDQTRVLGTSKTAATSSKDFKEYKVQVMARSGLNVRSKPGTAATCIIKKTLRYGEVYTIVEEKKVSNQTWGYLKSGAGWICLAYTKRV